jgi:glucosamine--fructose-6-phosphate aminotransferase (isomerizing)
VSESCSDFDLLAADIRRQPALLAERLPVLRQGADEICAGLPRPTRIYLVACGDGLSAALAAHFTWERLLGCPVEAVPAMTFSRYSVENAQPGALVVLISQSGKVVRMLEALACAQRRGLAVLVVTSHPDSPLARLAAGSPIFNLGYTRLGFVPGTSAYTVTLAALFELAAALSQNARLVEDVHQQIDRLPQALTMAVERAWQPVGEFTPQLDKNQVVFILGSGPAYGTAHYTMRKLFEICQTRAVLLETEEYAHDAFYAMDSRTPAVLFAPPDAGFRRCAEAAPYITGAGCPLIVISSPERQSQFVNRGISFVGLPSSCALETTLTYAVAAQVLACLAGRQLGGSFYACADPERYASGDAQIYESARMDLDE